ncbi:hypothetical protein Bca52824_065826 [Brassica carinata]|uniref:Uncharacterized protein n=1 Tax=Brassica carinata TaxID=52824 RepID=A0A8X7QJ89_BRACI|nr:hypothetical protein Bca52824_065826 [Brassica carinata]
MKNIIPCETPEWSMMFGFDPNEVDKTKETTTAATMNNSIIHAKGVKEDLVEGPKHGDLSYVASKRKVPHGPDPIHNSYPFQSTDPSMSMYVVSFSNIWHS